jgi:hypothetical protein
LGHVDQRRRYGREHGVRRVVAGVVDVRENGIAVLGRDPLQARRRTAAFTLTDGLNTWELTVAPTPITEGALAGELMLLNSG